MGKSSDLFNLASRRCESAEDCTNISTLLHRNDSELIFFINPDEESLLVVVENASSFRPISVQATCIKEPITFFEKEMVSDQLFSICFTH